MGPPSPASPRVPKSLKPPNEKRRVPRARSQQVRGWAGSHGAGWCSVHAAPSQGRVVWGVGGHEGRGVRPRTRGAQERAVWLMCPIKLLQTLLRQLLPAGPWVQIGSVSLPWGGVSGAREWWPAQSAHRGPSPAPSYLGPAVTPSSLCSLRHSSVSPRPPGSAIRVPCVPPSYPDPIPGSSRAIRTLTFFPQE